MEINLAPADPIYAEWWFKDRNDPETLKYNPLAPSTVESLRERLSKASSDLNAFETAESYFWIVKSGEDIVGHVTIQNINKMMGTAEIGYGVSNHVRGRGIATLEVKLLAQKVFAHTPIRKLIAFVHEQNTPSRRVLEKVGFLQEGILREHYLVNGKATNEVIYGLLKGEVI